MSDVDLTKYKYGSYVEFKIGELTILSIATVIYSVNHQPSEPDEDDPFNQFAWLREKLEQAVKASEMVWIVGHVPPGIETFGYSQLWKPKYVEAYLEIVQDPALGAVVAAQLFGHVHKDEIRLLPTIPSGAGPMLLSGSISPVYYNWPSFKMVEYCPVTKRLINVETFYAALTENSSEPLTWQFGYDLLQTYPTLPKHGILMKSFEEVSGSLLLGLDVYNSYAEWYATRFPSDLQKYGAVEGDPSLNETYRFNLRKQYVCATVVGDADSYESCAQDVMPSDLKELVMAIPFGELEETSCLIISRLIHRAAHSMTKTAKEIYQAAKAAAEAGDWEPFLRQYRALGQYGADLSRLM